MGQPFRRGVLTPSMRLSIPQLIHFSQPERNDPDTMQKIFAAVMTLMILATVIAVFVLGALSLTGGSVINPADQKGVTSDPGQLEDSPP